MKRLYRYAFLRIFNSSMEWPELLSSWYIILLDPPVSGIKALKATGRRKYRVITSNHPGLIRGDRTSFGWERIFDIKLYANADTMAADKFPELLDEKPQPGVG